MIGGFVFGSLLLIVDVLYNLSDVLLLFIVIIVWKIGVKFVNDCY